jgi:hypothetical protein
VQAECMLPQRRARKERSLPGQEETSHSPAFKPKPKPAGAR